VATHQPAAITLARILRPHGRRGEVAAEILTDFPERLKKLKSAELYDGRILADEAPNALRVAPRHAAIRSCWISHSRGGQAIFHFEGSNSISDAEKLVGLLVQIPFSERMRLPSGSYYVMDLVGCELFEKGGAAIGTVRDVDFIGEEVAGTPLLVVTAPHGEVLIPLAQDICLSVDIGARRIEVVLPEGLRELNQP